MSLEARHALPEGTADERVEHSHDYVIEVVVSGSDLDGRGYLIDIDVLRAGLSMVLDRYRGRLMNDLPEFVAAPPSMENLARQVWERLFPSLGGERINLTVRVWEDDSAWASYEDSVP
jgi:6-pyruvoyltetrahydropterin/6-carboxytetrahydropterin synthase